MEKLVGMLARAASMDDAQRLYRLHSDALGVCVVDRWTGRDALSGHTATDVDVLSLDAGLSLDGLPGTRATLTGRAADGSQWQRSGLVHQARRLGSDGGLVRYRLSLISWTWWLQHARHSRVFQEQSVRQIVDDVFQAHTGLAHWRWAEGCDAFLAGRLRSYCVQYRESDLAFVQRLLAEEGIGWRLCQDDQARCGNGMELFVDSLRLPQDTASAAGGVRFHRSDSVETRDGVQHLQRHAVLGSTRLSLHSDDYRSVRSVATELAVEGGGTSTREDYDAVGAYAFASWREAERMTRLQAEAREVRRRGWQGRGTVRGVHSGTWQVLQHTSATVAPDLLLVEVVHAGINNLPTDMRPTTIEGSGLSPLPSADPALWQSAARVGYANRFEAVERSCPWRPQLADSTGIRLNPRPTAPGYQTAIVVAAHAGRGDDVHADALGRVKVRFHFQDGQSGADDSAWLRVAQRYAGPGVGSQFLPRVGQEVMVGFLDGDIDRPLILGALYNGRGQGGIAPTPAGERRDAADRALYAQAGDQRRSAQGNLAGGNAPVWHAAGAGEDAHRHGGALWGMRSREWQGGSGGNQLLFGDCDQALWVQLASSQQVSQLTLGHNRHVADNFLGSLRGTGFELRSDAWGAVRATSGAWLSAYGSQAQAPAGEAVQPAALLKQLDVLSGRFNQIARIHLTSPLLTHEGSNGKQTSITVPDKAPLAGLLASVQTTIPGPDFADAAAQAKQRQSAPGANRVPHSGDPLLGLAAPAGIAHVAGQALHWAAGEALLLASGQHSDTTVMGQARLHAGRAIGVLANAAEGSGDSTALSLVAGNGELDIQAQNDSSHLQSRQALRMTSAQGAVELAAGKTLHIATAAGASLTIEGGNITFNCPGTIKVEAGVKSFLPGGRGRYPLPVFPQSVCKECLLLAAQRAAPLSPKG